MGKDAYYSLNGPKQLPILGNIHQVKVNTLHQTFEQWAKEYGLIYKIRLGPSKHIVITDPEIYQEIMKQRPHHFRRMEKMDIIFQEEGVHGVFNAEGEEWAIHRKLVAQGLDVKHQQQYFPSICTTTKRLKNKWQKLAQQAAGFDVQKDLVRYTVDVTTSLAFGYEMNTIEMGEDVIQNHLEKVFPTIFKRINAPLPIWRYYKSKSDKEFDTSFKEINRLIDEFITKGKQNLEENPSLKEQPRNFLEAILAEAENSSKTIDNKVIRGNLLTILMAGEDTTAHTLAWMIYYLCLYPEWQDELAEEVKPYVSQNGVVEDYALLSNLKLIEAFANETMRKKPVAPLLLFEPLSDIEIKGYKFEKGRRLLIQTRHAAVNDDFFSDGASFNPNRWLGIEKCPHYKNHNIKAFIPFGSGPRFCPGRNLALTEIKMVIAMLVNNFKLKLVTKPENIEEVMAFTMMANSFDIALTERVESKVYA